MNASKASERIEAFSAPPLWVMPLPSTTSSAKPSRRALSAQAAPLTTLALRRESWPSVASGYFCISQREATKPRIASPKNSSRWLEATPCSRAALPCTNAGSTSAVSSSGTPAVFKSARRRARRFSPAKLQAPRPVDHRHECFPNTTDVLWPPKPNALDSATAIGALRATLGT